MGRKKKTHDEYVKQVNDINPNIDVNMAQSTNDAFPSAAKMTIIDLFNPLLSSLENLVETLLEKAKELLQKTKYLIAGYFFLNKLTSMSKNSEPPL